MNDRGAVRLEKNALFSGDFSGDTKPQLRLIPQVIAEIREKHYSYVTEKAYVHWILRFIRFHNLRHPKEKGEKEISDFLTHLAVTMRVSASTQNQALNALVFLYKCVIGTELGDFSSFARAKSSHFLPAVLTQDEVQEETISQLEHKQQLSRTEQNKIGQNPDLNTELPEIRRNTAPLPKITKKLCFRRLSSTVRCWSAIRTCVFMLTNYFRVYGNKLVALT